MTPLRRPLALLVALPCLACPASEPSGAARRDEPQTETKPATPTSSPGKPAPEKPVTEAPERDTTGPLPAIKILAEARDCAPPPEPSTDASEAQRSLQPLVTSLRAVACKPEIFGQPLAAARESLAIADDLPFELGRRYARFELGDAPVRVHDLLAALGIRGATMKLEQGMAPRWVVEVTRFEPGIIRIPIAADRHEERPDGTELEIPANTPIAGAVSVSMAPEVLAFADDIHAGPSLADALTRLSEQPALLGKEPAEAHAELASLGERFELLRYSEGLGDEQRVGFSIRPLRTELVAADLVRALGLEAATHERIRIYDANPDRLAADGETPFVWRGLELDIELEAREHGLGLRGWLIDEIQVLPAAADDTN